MSPSPTRPLFAIREPRQIAVLGSPARQEVLDGLQVLGPCSIAELAESLGRAPDSLYYHVRKLERAGLVVAAGTRPAGPRPEALYDVPGRMVVDHQPTTARERRALRGLVSSALRIGERDLVAALESGRARYGRGPERNAWGGRNKGWLTPAELAQARAHLEALSELLARGSKRPGAALHAVAFVLAPLAPSPRTRRPRKRPSQGVSP
jgi:DNA-binding transcriptional ArsR family regulator